MKSGHDHELTMAELRRAREAVDGPLAQELGLRERKKRLMRELISDTATLMFLERGFDEVRVSEVAAACDVSEKTIYNYFPTKESLLLDREEDTADALRQALGPDAEHDSPVDAALSIIIHDLDRFMEYLSDTTAAARQQILAFNDLIENTPALKAARADMTERLSGVAAAALAERVGVDPDDPEPQIAAEALMGLWHIYYRGLIKHSQNSSSPSVIKVAVLDDVHRAARLIDTGLSSFATVTSGAKGRRHHQATEEAAAEARKQVLIAIKEARDAWRVIKTSVESHQRNEALAKHAGSTSAKLAKQQARAAAQANAEEIKRHVRQTKLEVKEAVKRVKKSVR